MRCPEIDKIIDLVEAKLNAADRKKIEAHVVECSQCAEARAWFTKTVRLMRSDSLENAPEHVIQEAIRNFSTKQKPAMDWIPAKLEFDSWMVPSMQGIRASDRGPRQWVYQTGQYKVILMVQQHENERALIGQLLPLRPAVETRGCLVEIQGKAKAVTRKITNENGEFLVTAIKGKNFEIKIHGDSESVMISLAS